MKSVKVRLAILLLVIASIVWGFNQLIFFQLPYIFNSQLEDMSFGWFVLPFSLYVLWRERDELIKSMGAPDWRGLLMAIPFLFIGFIGVRGVQVRFGVVSIVGLLLSLAWGFFGLRTMKRVLFPALFLLFCIPLATFLDVVTVHLRLFATSVAYWVMNGLGLEVIRQGTMITSSSGAFTIDVAEPCSGLRSIFALAAVTAGYAYFNQPTWPRRLLLFSLSVPLAIIGNASRILSICLVGQFIGGDFALGFYHDYSGYVVFIVALSLMVLSGECITRIFGEVPPRPSEGEVDAAKNHSVVIPAALAAMVIAMMFLQASTPEVVVADPPNVHLGEIGGLKFEELPMSEAELTTLPKDTKIEKRHYTAPNGWWATVNMVVGGREKSSIHRPELCLPAQGFLMMNPHNLQVGDVSWRMLTLAGNDGTNFGFAYTFFNQDGYRTSSHVARIFRDVWDRSVHNRIDRWVMVTVMVCRDSEDAMRGFLKDLEGSIK